VTTALAGAMCKQVRCGPIVAQPNVRLKRLNDHLCPLGRCAGLVPWCASHVRVVMGAVHIVHLLSAAGAVTRYSVPAGCRGQ